MLLFRNSLLPAPSASVILLAARCGDVNECPVCPPPAAAAGWIPQISPTSASLAEIKAIDESMLFAAGDSG